jgi:hypothetical protein
VAEIVLKIFATARLTQYNRVQAQVVMQNGLPAVDHHVVQNTVTPNR